MKKGRLKGRLKPFANSWRKGLVLITMKQFKELSRYLPWKFWITLWKNYLLPTPIVVP
jgi:hypothetical protein